MPGYAVVHVLTTGLRPGRGNDIVELGVVLLDAGGRTEQMWQTLLRPPADPRRADLHGINRADLAAAPTFADVADTVAGLLARRVLVAHDVWPAVGALRAEFEAVGRVVPIRTATAVCTMRWAGRFIVHAPRSLAGCCARTDVSVAQRPTALESAIATAGLLHRFIGIGTRAAGVWRAPWADLERVAGASPESAYETSAYRPEVVRSRPSGPAPALAALVDALPGRCGTTAEVRYLSLLDRALRWGFVGTRDQEDLADAAVDLALSTRDVVELHHLYLRCLTREAVDDGAVSPEWGERLGRVAVFLGLAPEEADADLAEARAPGYGEELHLAPGDVVVFTGPTDVPKETWETRAIIAGLVPHPMVTPRTRVVVAADPDALYGNARKASQFGVPVVTEKSFARLLAERAAPAGAR